MLCTARATPPIATKTRSSTRTPPHPSPRAAKQALALPALVAAGLAAQLVALVPLPAQALEEARPVHLTCAARRHAHAAAACVSSLARVPARVDAAPVLLEAEAGGERSKAAIAAERRERVRAQVTVLADGALKALMQQGRAGGSP